MYLIKRVTKHGGRMQVTIAQPTGSEAGLNAGGSYTFDPAGTENGETEHHVSEHAARVMMTDPGMKEHFSCSPNLPKPEAAAKTAPARKQADQ